MYCTCECVCGGGVVGGKCVKLCTAHVSVCGGGVVGGKCVKLCTPPPHM